MTANLRLLSAVLSDASTLSATPGTNKLLQSRSLGTAPWTGDATVSGGLTVTDNSNSATQSWSQTIAIPNDSASYTLTLAFPMSQSSSGAAVRVSFTCTGGTLCGGALVFDKFSPTTYNQATVVGGFTYSLLGLPAVWGGNHVITMTVTNNSSGNTALNVLINPAYAANHAYTNDVTQMDSFSVSWVQVEDGKHTTGFVPTTTAAVTGGDFLASLPVNNLRLEGRGRVARRASNIGGIHIKGNILDATGTVSARLSAMVLHRHNLDSVSGIRLQLFSGNSQGGSVLYDSGIVDAVGNLRWNGFGWFGSVAMPQYSVLWFAPVTNVYSFQITIFPRLWTSGDLLDTGPAQIKRLLLGEYVEPTLNPAYGMKLGWKDDSVQRRTQGGSIRTDPRARYRQMSGTFDAMVEADRASWTATQYAAALRNEIFMSAFPDATDARVRDFSMLGKFSALPANVVSRPTTVASGFEIEEV